MDKWLLSQRNKKCQNNRGGRQLYLVLERVLHDRAPPRPEPHGPHPNRAKARGDAGGLTQCQRAAAPGHPDHRATDFRPWRGKHFARPSHCQWCFEL